MSHTERAAQKRAVFAELLQSGIAALHLDPRAPGVQVPARFGGQPQLVLNFSYRYRLHDFEFDDEVVQATLSFGGQPFFCRLPWYAVFAVTNDGRDKGRVWSQDVPPEMGGPARDWPEPPAQRVPVRKGKPSLRVLREADAEVTDREVAPSRAETTVHPSSERPRPALRAVGKAPAASEAEGPPAPPDTTPPTPPRTGGHLRRIK